VKRRYQELMELASYDTNVGQYSARKMPKRNSRHWEENRIMLNLDQAWQEEWGFPLVLESSSG
jgi:hypothetical protein